MTASGRTLFATSGRISGSGLASARISGLSAICATISALRTPPAERPRKTSASGMISASVRADVFRLQPQAREQIETCKRGGTRARADELRLCNVLAHDAQSVQHRSADDDR